MKLWLYTGNSEFIPPPISPKLKMPKSYFFFLIVGLEKTDKLRKKNNSLAFSLWKYRQLYLFF